MVAHGLTTRREGAQPHHRASPPPAEWRRGAAAGAAARVELDADERELVEARTRLAALVWPPRVLRPEQARVWSRATLLELGCGWERGRVIIPIRHRDGGLRGFCATRPAMTMRRRCWRCAAHGWG